MKQSLETIKRLAGDKFAWPGGYPMYGVMRDGGPICCDCIIKEWPRIEEATKDNGRTGWEIEGIDINHEDGECFCCNCDKKI